MIKLFVTVENLLFGFILLQREAVHNRARKLKQHYREVKSN